MEPVFAFLEVFRPFGWIFLVLLAANVVLFALLVLLREQWAFLARRRKRVRSRLAPLYEPLVDGSDPEQVVADLRPILAGLGRQERAVAAWLLIDLSRDSDEATHRRLRESLDESGAIEVAERGTRRWMPWRRALACEILGSFGVERSVDALIERLDDTQSEVRIAAARALGEIGSPAAAPALSSLFLERRAVPTGVSHDALRNLGPAGASAFERGLESPDPTVRVASCFGCAAHGGRAMAEALAALLERDENIRVRTAAAKGLGVMGGPAPPRALLEAAMDPEVRVRREAVAALGSFDEPSAVGVLADAVEDPDRELALRAAESLVALAERPRAGQPARAALAAASAWSVDYSGTIAALSA
jgi:HEAT repeat protein